MKVGVMPRADTRKLRSAGEPDALKGASPVREGAVGNLRQPVVPVVRRHESQQGAGRLLHKKGRRRTTDYTDHTDKKRRFGQLRTLPFNVFVFPIRVIRVIRG